jgi:ABC-type Fe3+ transport system permease subunit
MMGALVFLLAFADFELASLWSVKTWTVSIFDAQTGGMALGETLRLAAAPFAVQAAVLVLGSIVGRAAIRSLAEISADRGRRRANRLCGPFAVCAALVGCIVPLAIVAWQAFAGIATVVENFVLTREVGASVLFALGAAALASACAPRTPRVCAMPGLLGALVIALLVLALFQLPILRAVYDTPLPLLIALCIVLFPVAAIMEAIARMGRMSPMRHIAGQFPSPRLNWELRLRPLFAAFALLFWCAYFDFTASSILAPLDMTPVFVRLHNLAHYRQTAVLSAMMLAAFAAPGALLLLTLGAGEIYARRNGR